MTFSFGYNVPCSNLAVDGNGSVEIGSDMANGKHLNEYYQGKKLEKI
jgi:hypothetical protein